MKKTQAKTLPRDRMLIPRGRENLKCKHCDDKIHRDAFCEQCQKFLDDQCSACHDELAHDEIRVQNTNTHGGRKLQDRRRKRSQSRVRQFNRDTELGTWKFAPDEDRR